MKEPTALRHCEHCGTTYRGMRYVLTDEDAAKTVELSRKAHARTKTGRACHTQVQHRKVVQLSAEVGTWQVGVDKRGVWFSIDHQKFRLHVDAEPERGRQGYFTWYARQLRIALRRLAERSL
jgi:hypothetical protein